ncbi:MAG: 16S rRNA (cytosine(1402)-N(4))-methyltransferase RsmH [Candidatus Saganbacteria bacterium]|nr:16S rRNA (cytosine(1402)-N(4))-methyltransferase RsmH [Candidatus Saganbacteria bacterium]
MNEYRHTPVLLNEAIKMIDPEPGDVIVDGTLGGGGHSEAILKNIKGKGHLIGIDLDMEAIEAGKERLSGYKNVTLVHGNFADIKKIVNENGFKLVDGILFDLGVSSHEIDTAERGFSLRIDGPLDMRMDRSKAKTAAHLINTLDALRLENIFMEYGEERYSRRIARAIVRERDTKHILRTLHLANLIKSSVPGMAPDKKQGIVTRIFQALRIAVNFELDNLKNALRDSIELLKPGGRIIVISYHSLEDRIVKTIFREQAKDCICAKEVPVCICGHTKKIKILTPKPIGPTEAEIETNSRARSAKLRGAERL